jgi:hypothetical protein
MTIGIYKLKIKGLARVYVGSSFNIESRYKTHVRELANGTHHNYKLQNAYNRKIRRKQQVEFELEIIEVIDTKDDLLLSELEHFWIVCLDAVVKGYNVNYDTCRLYRPNRKRVKQVH